MFRAASDLCNTAYAVYFYVRFPVSYRDLEEIMAERGVDLDHATLNRWVEKYAGAIAEEAHLWKSPTGRSWRTLHPPGLKNGRTARLAETLKRCFRRQTSKVCSRDELPRRRHSKTDVMATSIKVEAKKSGA